MTFPDGFSWLLTALRTHPEDAPFGGITISYTYDYCGRSSHDGIKYLTIHLSMDRALVGGLHLAEKLWL
jgi:hypothetical protein